MDKSLSTFYTDESGMWLVTATLVEPAPPQVPRRKRRRYDRRLRSMLLELQEHRCATCRGPLGVRESHVDHIVPVAAGGTDDLTNLQLLHMDCNLRKADKTIDQALRFPWA